MHMLCPSVVCLCAIGATISTVGEKYKKSIIIFFFLVLNFPAVVISWSSIFTFCYFINSFIVGGFDKGGFCHKLEKQSKTADLRQRHVVRQVTSPYLVWQRFPLYPI